MIPMKTAHKRLLALALIPFLVCALLYGCRKEEPPEEITEEYVYSTEDPWATEETTEEEEETEEETEPPTSTTRRTSTTTRTTTKTTTTTTTTTKTGDTTIPDGSDKATTTTTTTTSVAKTVAVTGVKFNGASSYTLSAGSTQSLSWTVSPANATNKKVTLVSTNSSVASVTNTGQVTAKGAGNCQIIIKTEEGDFQDSVSVSVTAVMVNSITIFGGGSVNTGGSLQLTANVGPSNATNKSVTWSVSDTAAASISSSGVLKANQTGYVVVTATANDGSGVSDSRTINITS